MTQTDLLQQDAAHRQRALELQSFIVEAPAGAGKTELLTQRYLKLLAVVREPEEIVAITFTNKAAAEMRGRVLQSLQDAADAVPIDKPHKQVTRALALAALRQSNELGWDLLAQPGRLRINTIDSLCSLLARQMPLLSRFGGQPAVSDDAAPHYQEAARRALAMLEDEGGSGPVAEALHYLDNDAVRLAALLADMLARRDQWLPHTGRHSAQDEAEAALHHLVAHDIARAAQVLTPELQARLMPLARYAASNLDCSHTVALLADWDTSIPPTPEALPLWRALCEFLLTGQGGWRKSLDKRQGFPATEEGRGEKQALLGIIQNDLAASFAPIPPPAPPLKGGGQTAVVSHPPFQGAGWGGDGGNTSSQQPALQALARLRALPDARHGDEEWRIVGALARLLQLAAAHLLAVFQEAGEVDFVEVASRALLALEDESGPTDLALRLDYRIRHLLVDEFQDTSPAQVELLRRLTQGWEPDDGRTLFCVGDPMQSIYRFRKADVGLFLQVAEYGIGHLRLERLHLTRNNRSCPAVVEWVNAAFAKVFPSHDSVTRGAIRYRPFAATRAADPYPHPCPLPEGDAASPCEHHFHEGVLVHPLVADSGGDGLAALEARHVAQLIARERECNPGASIAVLVRARTHLEQLVAEIRRNHPELRFQAVEVEALAGRQTVQDVLALTRALFHRADRVNWLAVLRAPWCGLTLADLHALAADDHHATVWRLMQDEARLARLSEDGRQRLLHVRAVIAEAYAHQGRQSARRWVESTWIKLSGPHCLWDAGDVRDVRALLDLIEKLEAGGGLDPDRLEQAMAELYAAPDVQADGNLQFMTIHKSKGLEFDTVILPGLHRQPRNSDSPLLLWEEVAIDDDPPRLVAAPWVPKHRRDGLPSAYDYLQGLENERSANEAARLLYVAATRAERRLHLVAALKVDSKGDIKPPANSLLQLLWDSVGGEFLNAAPQVLPADETDEAGFVPQLIRLPRPAVPTLLQAEAATPAAMAFDDMTEPAEEGGGLEADCGTLAHLYLEMMARDGLQGWSVERLHGLRPAMQAWLEARGHSREEAEQGAARVEQALCNTLASADGQWVLRAREGAASELAIATAVGARIATHVVDRTFIEDGVRWVVDYKSARLDEMAPEQQAQRYRPQLERYAALFRDEGLPVRMAVFFLARGRLVELN